MNYEEKYKEALEKAQIYRNHLIETGDDTNEIEYIFPEIVEIENEKIRKEILSVIRQFDKNTTLCGKNYDYNKWIAWLEKQGEQKTAWSEEDETNLTNTIIMLKEGAGLHFTNSSITPCVDWLKSLKNRVQPQPKQEWSEYDKIQLSEAIQMIEANGTWIRSEDAVKKVSNWLKSLKPNHWKPSEEQLNAFEHFVRSIGESGYASPYDNNTKLIYSLLNDLKNL